MKTVVEVIKQDRVDDAPEQYNTACHRISEHPAHRDESTKEFDLEATTFDKWLPLIAQSRGIQGQIETLHVPRWLIRTFKDAVKGYRASGQVMQSVLKEMLQEPPFRAVSFLDGRRRWFFRADDVSPKDGVSGTVPVCTTEDVLTLLLTSWRLHGAYCRFMAKEGNDSFTLHFLPWDDQASSLRQLMIFNMRA